MGSAAQRSETVEELGRGTVAAETAVTDGGLKQAVAERLAAHRSRRAAERAQQAQAAQQEALLRGSGRKVSQVRDAVAARYEQSVSYREFLAAEAERSLQQAQAEAEVAARKAVAVAEAKMQLMQEIEHWNRSEEAEQQAVREVPRLEPAGISVQLYEDVSLVPMVEERARPAIAEVVSVEELRELEQEIAFRLAPEIEPYVLESQPIPGNLIEFPRQLVAPRKARPRLAEGPLREDAPVEPQLRIFEVEPEQISVQPAALPTAAPEWQSLLLDAANAAAPTVPLNAQMDFNLPLQTASLQLRTMAAVVDGAWVGAGFVGFATVAVELVGKNLRALPLPLLGASAAAVLGILYVTYQLLFFSLSGATPGMTYARIGLCTFGDRNPTRKAMRMRVIATLLAACPLGLGIAWAWLDEEKLGWHDRMSRMYQRGY